MATQYSCHGNTMDRKARQANTHGVTKASDITQQLKNNNSSWLQQITDSGFKTGNQFFVLFCLFFIPINWTFCYHLCLYSKFSFQMGHNLFLQMYKWIEHLGASKYFHLSVNQIFKVQFLKQLVPSCSFSLVLYLLQSEISWDSINENVCVLQLAFNSCQFRNSELFKVVLAVLRLASSTSICANGTENAVSK